MERGDKNVCSYENGEKTARANANEPHRYVEPFRQAAGRERRRETGGGHRYEKTHSRSRNDYIGERDTAGIADSVSRSAQTDARRFKDISDKYTLKLNDKQRDMVYQAVKADKSIAGKGLQYDGYRRDFAQVAAEASGWPRLDFKSIAEIIEGRYTKGDLSGKVSMESVPSVQGTYVESMLRGLPVEASQGQPPAEKVASRDKGLISGIKSGRTDLQARGYHLRS